MFIKNEQINPLLDEIFNKGNTALDETGRDDRKGAEEGEGLDM